MKGKVIRGKGFRGCLNYLLAQFKQARIIGGNMCGRTARALAREFGHVRRLRPDCEKPVLHVPLRLPKGEDIADELWRQITIRYFELMRLSSDRPYVIVKHPDEHTHILTSRISLAGELWHGKWEGLEHIAATQTLEREFGQTITPGLTGGNPKKVRLTSGQLAKYAREMAEGKDPEIPAKIQIAERIELVMAECDGSFADFEQRLKKRGVNLELNRAKTTSHVSGVSFEWQGVAIGGSDVARAYSWKNLNKQLTKRKEKYEQQRHPQPNAPTSPGTNQERTTANPAGPTTRGTDASGTQNRDVDIGVQSILAPIPGTATPVADANANHGHPARPADRPAPGPATPLEHPVPPASPVATDQLAIDRAGEPAGREHQGDLCLVEETCPGEPAPVAPGLPGLNHSDTPGPDLEPPPPELTR